MLGTFRETIAVTAGEHSQLEDYVMIKKLSLKYPLEWISFAAAAIAALVVFYTFIFGQHYIIPTIALVNTVILANIAYYGMQDRRWARTILFWVATITSAHAFFSLFWAKAPREILGDAFLPIYGCVFFIFGFLAWTYRKEAFITTRS
jgi:hypothetical protein